MGVLNTINESHVHGSDITLKATDKRHYTNKLKGEEAQNVSFSDLVRKGLESANSDQMEKSEIFEKMITNPDSVEVHDVTIAMAKANMSLNMTKSLVDGAVKAYKDIVNMR